MHTAIVKIQDNRVAQYAKFETAQEAQAHCDLYGGFVYEGDYSQDLWIDGEAVTIVPLVSLADIKDKLVSSMDNLVASIYNQWTRFEAEYELREAEAHGFKDAGYTGDVPRQVAAFADRANLPAQQATDLILSQAAALRTALANLGDLRMRKYEIINAPDAATAQTLFDQIKALIKAEAANIA